MSSGNKYKMNNRVLRQELIKLSELGEIKQKRKFLEKAPEGTLVAILEKYETEKIKEVNEVATEQVLTHMSSILCWFNVVKKRYESNLKEDLEKNKLLRNDIEKIVGIMVTPFLPFVGLATGGVTVGRYALQSHMTKEEEQDTHIPPSQDNDPLPSEDEQKEQDQ